MYLLFPVASLWEKAGDFCVGGGEITEE